MAKKYAVKPADLGETIFPLCLDISGRRYKILVKSSHVKFISENSEQVIRELGAVFPPVPPSDPIYVDIVEGHMVVPGVKFAGQDQPTHSDHPAVSGTAQDIMLENTESCNNAEWEEDDTCMPGPSRFDWKLTFTRKLLSILEEMKKRTGKDFALTKAVWPKLEKEMSKTCSPAPTAIQCREKFYSLKRYYRKYVME
ncbi:uncharacterized protein LOC144622576 [Crassostrea virginica]